MVKIFLSKGEKSLISELLLNALNTEYGLSLTDTDIKIDDNGKLCGGGNYAFVFPLYRLRRG